MPFTVSLMRLGGTSRSRANLFVLIPIGNGFVWVAGRSFILSVSAHGFKRY